MFGGIAAAGANRLVYATHTGHVLTLNVDSGEIAAAFAMLPYGELGNFSACVVAPDKTILVADPRRRRVRRFSQEGRQVARLGNAPIPGLMGQDEDGVLEGPCELFSEGDEVFVCCAGEDLEHGVQRFALDGTYRSSLACGGDTAEPWKRPRGIARVGDRYWIAESFAGRVRLHDAAGAYLGDLEIDEELGRPVRLAMDGYGAVLAILEPSDDKADEPGIARISGDGEFVEWAVLPGDAAGTARNAFDLAVMPDGRFAVADVPTGAPSDVRIQLFAADGRLERVLVEGEDALARDEAAFRAELLAAEPVGADALYRRGEVHQIEGRHAEAAASYRRVLEADPGHALAHLALATLLQGPISDPAAAETEYRAAIDAGEPASELLPRVAACRHAVGDADSAIRILQEVVEGPTPPEEYERWVETLADYFLTRAGHDPKAV